MITVADGLCADGGEIGARTRLGIALTPPVLTGKDSWQKLPLLRLIAEGVDNGADHGDAKRQWRQRACAGGLLLEDEAAGDRPAGPAIFLKPEWRDPALPVQDAVPQQHLFLAQVG